MACNSSVVIDALTSNYASTPTIYFYCKYNETPRAKAFSIIRSLLRQLSVASETLGPEILGAFRSTKGLGDITASLDFSDVEALFTGAISQTGGAFVVIDALDECVEHARVELISFLRELLALDSCQVKIFLTSRPEDDLHHSLRDQRTYAIGVSDTAQDIGSFVTCSVDDLIGRKALLYGKPVTQDLRDYLITTLTKEADGVYVILCVSEGLLSEYDMLRCRNRFLWARYQLEAICELGNETQIRDQLRHLPRGLEETYISVWERIRGFSKAKSSMAYRVLKWILSATRPLSSEEIIIASAIKPLDTKFQEQQTFSLGFLVSACGNLVYEDYKGDLRFVHTSVQEFLMQQPELKDAEGFVADVCFTALAFPQPPTAIWGYVARNWAQHARCWREINDNRNTLIERFLLSAPRLEEWARALSKVQLLRSVDSATPPLPPIKYGAIGICASFNIPIVLDHLLRRNAKHSEGNYSELVSSALLLAAAGGHFDVANSLLKAGADTRWRASNRLVTLQFNWQTGYGVGAILPDIVSHGRNTLSATALQVAAGGGHTKVVTLLLEHNAKINDCGLFIVPRDHLGRNNVRSEPDITTIDTSLILCRYSAKRPCKQHA